MLLGGWTTADKFTFDSARYKQQQVLNCLPLPNCESSLTVSVSATMKIIHDYQQWLALCYEVHRQLNALWYEPYVRLTWEGLTERHGTSQPCDDHVWYLTLLNFPGLEWVTTLHICLGHFFPRRILKHIIRWKINRGTATSDLERVINVLSILQGSLCRPCQTPSEQTSNLCIKIDGVCLRSVEIHGGLERKIRNNVPFFLAWTSAIAST